MGGLSPRDRRCGIVEGQFRCLWRLSGDGSTLTIVARQRRRKRPRSAMAVRDTWSLRAGPPKPMSVRKALMLTFFRNGDPFHPGTRVSFLPGKDFPSLESLCDYLTPRAALSSAVRYVFTLDGRLIADLTDLEDGQAYVVSGNRNFQNCPYGRATRIGYARPQRPVADSLTLDDLKLLRPVSPPVRSTRKNFAIRTPRNPRSRSLPTQHEGRAITVVSRHNPDLSSRVLLNLRTSQPFEEVLEDLGQSIRLRQASKMYNDKGEEIRSFSQLKKELRKNDTFYIETEQEDGIPGDKDEEGYFSMDIEGEPQPEKVRSVASGSLPNLHDFGEDQDSSQQSTTFLQEVDLDENHLPKLPSTPSGFSNDLPATGMELHWVHGYQGQGSGGNLYLTKSGELLYYTGSVVVLHHPLESHQRHYVEHYEDIQCMAIHNEEELSATGQGRGPAATTQAHVRVWRTDTLTTLSVVGESRMTGRLVDVAFSGDGQLLLVLEEAKSHESAVSLWEWRNGMEVGRSAVDCLALGGAFHPTEENMVITFGEEHLTFWVKRNDGFLDRHDAIDKSHPGLTVLSVEFLNDGSIVTGNSKGFVTIWSQSEEDSGSFFIRKEFKAHNRDVSALLLLPDGILLSGSSSGEDDGHVRAWDSKKRFSRVAMTTFPQGSGGVTSLCPQRKMTSDLEIFVGTNQNIILEGSVTWNFNPLVHGHYGEVRALAVHPRSPMFVSASLDKHICKWNVTSLVWKVQTDAECLSAAVHPNGAVVAVGDDCGDVTFLTMEAGIHVTTMPVADNALYVVKYSPDGGFLAVGCADGNIYVLSSHRNGRSYRRGVILEGTAPILNLDWSSDSLYIQAVVADGDYQDLAFWNVGGTIKLQTPSKVRSLEWANSTCSLAYDILGIWKNEKLKEVIYSTCNVSNSRETLAAGDSVGFIRLFRFPCISKEAAFFEKRQGGHRVDGLHFLYGDKFLLSSGGHNGTVFVWRLSSVHR